MKREFKTMGNLIYQRRTCLRMSQGELAKRLGYKNGQFTSNMERGLCNLPVNQFGKIAKLLFISREELISAALKDLEIHLDKQFNKTEKEIEGYVISDKILKPQDYEFLN